MTYDEMTSDELRQHRDAINAVLDSRADAERAEAEAKILELAKASGVDLKKLAGGTKAAPKNPGRVVAIKYRDEAGQTWTGRGKTPKWAADRKAAGTLEDCRVAA